MVFKFNIQHYQTVEIETAIAPLSNVVSLPYENA